MTIKNDGGPAYPSFKEYDYNMGGEWKAGMSLRDAIAIAVAPAVASHILNGVMSGYKHRDPNITVAQLIAKEIYVYADAVLEERVK